MMIHQLPLTGNIFITYSEDTAGEIIAFSKFLTDQGFDLAVSTDMSPSSS